MKRLMSYFILSALLLGLCACGGALPAGEAAATAEPTPAPTPDAGAETAQPVQAAQTAEPAPTEEPAPQPVSGGDGAAPVTLVRPVYPEMARYPDLEGDGGPYDQEAWTAWRDSLDRQREQPAGYADGLEPYLRASLTEFLSGAGKENRVCAPLNIYMCLAMLAEITDGESRAQVLSLLGEKSLESLRRRAGAIWNAEYRDDGLVTCRLAASVWLNQYVSFIQETLDSLAENCYASGFRGKMGSAEYDKALQDWLNEQTGDLLKDQASGLHMDPDTLLALATTIYFKAPWADEFNKAGTTPQTFYGAKAEETADFMRRSSRGEYYWGEGFTAAALSLEQGSGRVWFLLPEEGLSPEDLLAGEAMDFLLSREKAEWENRKSMLIHFSVPRFDVSSDLELTEGLKNLGVRDLFDPRVSDFTPLTADTEEVYVSQISHAARVMIDEEGCTGAAYTVAMVAAAGMFVQEEEVDFVLDRPFIFAVTGWDGLPLFAGIVNTTK